MLFSKVERAGVCVFLNSEVLTKHTDKETPTLPHFSRFWASYEEKFRGTRQLLLLNKILLTLISNVNSGKMSE